MQKKRRLTLVTLVSVLLAIMMCFVMTSMQTVIVGEHVGNSTREKIAEIISAVLCVVVTTTFAYLFPAEKYTLTPGVSRIFAIAASLCGVLAGVLTSSTGHFGIALFLLMFAVVAGGFLFEMLRIERTELIKSLSSLVFMGTLGLVSSGWMALPDAAAFLSHSALGTKIGAGVVVFIGLAVVSLSVALWSCDVYADAQDNADLTSLEQTQVWGYSGAAMLLSGVFPLLIALTGALGAALA